MAIVLPHRSGGFDPGLGHKYDIGARVSEVVISNLGIENEALLQDSQYLLPEGTFDTHVHVFDPRLGSYSPTRSYTPERASYTSLSDFSKTLSASTPTAPATFVLVQASPYRTDNRVLLHLLKKCQGENIRARGIAVVDIETVTEKELKEMHTLGVRGLRLNMQADGKDVDIPVLERVLKAAAERISRLPGWKLQIYAPAYIWTALQSTIEKLPVPIIADHVGGLSGPSKLPLELFNNPTRQPGFGALISLAKSSHVYVKISGLYRASDDQHNGFADMEPIVRKLAAEIPDKLIWGSDWPHTGEGKDRVQKEDVNQTEPFRVINNVAILKNLRQWVGSEENWQKMMVVTPGKVFV